MLLLLLLLLRWHRVGYIRSCTTQSLFSLIIFIVCTGRKIHIVVKWNTERFPLDLLFICINIARLKMIIGKV